MPLRATTASSTWYTYLWLEATLRATIRTLPKVPIYLICFAKKRSQQPLAIEHVRLLFSPQDYLAAAVDYLEEEDNPPPVDIKGILVASDNATIVDEVRDLAHLYFPSVRSENVVFIADGVPDGIKNTGMTTQTRTQVLMAAKTKSSSKVTKQKAHPAVGVTLLCLLRQ